MPTPGDGVADVVVVGPPGDATAPEGQEKTMALDLIDSVNASLLATASAQNLDQAGKGHTFVMEQARLGHQASTGLLSAIAAQELRTSAQARETMQLRGAKDQPG